MKKLMMFLIACLLLTGWQAAGYCEDEVVSDLTDSGGIAQAEPVIGQSYSAEVSISQAESGSMGEGGIAQPKPAMDQDLDPKIKEDETQSEDEIGEMDESVDSGGMAN